QAGAVGGGKGPALHGPAAPAEHPVEQRGRRRRGGDADREPPPEHARHEQVDARGDIGEPDRRRAPHALALPAPQVAHEYGRVARDVADDFLGLGHGRLASGAWRSRQVRQGTLEDANGRRDRGAGDGKVAPAGRTGGAQLYWWAWEGSSSPAQPALPAVP